MTFKEILVRYNPIISKNQLNKILALTERNFGVFSPDMELDIRSIIKNIEVEEYFDRIIHEEHPKLEYDKMPDVPTVKKGKNKMPWDNEELDCTLIGIDFNYPNNVTVCVAYRKNGKLRRERIDIDTSVISNFAEKKYIILPKARILMLAYTLLTLKYKGITFDFIHYILRGRKIKNVDSNELWSRANGIYEQLHSPDEIVKKAGQYDFKPSKRTEYLNRIFKIDTPNLDFFKWGLPANSHTGWAIAVYLTNPTRFRERRKKEYQKYVTSENEKIKKEKSKAKKEKPEDKSFSFINSKWNSWGNYNLIDD